MHLKNVITRVIYDRVRNRKNNFEIAVFLNLEWGTSRAGNSNEKKNTSQLLAAKCHITLNFPALDIPRSNGRKQKGGNFKITFPVPYPIIYNPARNRNPSFGYPDPSITSISSSSGAHFSSTWVVGSSGTGWWWWLLPKSLMTLCIQVVNCCCLRDLKKPNAKAGEIYHILPLQLEY